MRIEVILKVWVKNKNHRKTKFLNYVNVAVGTKAMTADSVMLPVKSLTKGF